MTNIDVIFHSFVILMSLVIFFLEITARNDFLLVILRLLGKLAPIFCIVISVIEFVKYFKII